MSDPYPSHEDEWHPFDEDSFSREQTQQEDKLGFCQLTDWDEERAYDEDPPKYIHYSIEWKVTVNNREVSKETEPDLVLAPASYWRLFLQLNLEKVLLRKMLAKNKTVKCEDTKIVVTNTKRGDPGVTKGFDDIDIDLSVIEKQLILWGDLFRAGKKLRVNISFNYVETGQPSAMSSRRSTTQQMLTERAAQLDVEEESSGQPSIWNKVYSLMRCPGPPCHLGPHCWRDPVGKKHYKLRTKHLKSLMRHVEQGYELKTHADVPEEVREQLYAEEQQGLERRQTAASTSAATFPPINITNVLPGQPYHTPAGSVPAEIPVLDMPSTPVNRLEIPGLRDAAVDEYKAWQQSQVKYEIQKVEFQKACDAALEEGLDLEQIHEDQDYKFFIDKGVKRGIARRFVDDIENWAKRHKQGVD
jgi:hypothetical protein